MLKNFKPRLYQEKIFSTCAQQNSLVVLSTGLGKTAIALMMASHRLSIYPKSKIVVLAPTKPLVEQHLSYFKDNMDLHEDEFTLFTGLIPPAKRAELWKETRLVFSTPQGLENDIISSRIDLKDVSLIVFDEAHRAVGGYSYVFIADRYVKLSRYPRVLALTASPGSDKTIVEEICSSLSIENIEVRTSDDPDVLPYIKDTEVTWREVILPPSMMQIRTFIDTMYKERLNEIKKYGYVKNTMGLSRAQMISMMGSLQKNLMEGEKTIELMKTISLLSEALKIGHALELVETQGIGSLRVYMKKLMSESQSTKTKAVKNIVADTKFKSAYMMAGHLEEANIEHPKIEELKRIAISNKGKKKIIFTQYRESGKKVVDMLKSLDIEAQLFVGQAKKSNTGMTQKKQLSVLKSFRENEFDTLVMTSVGEEGLDIPQVDLVVFYEPIPSAIRTIQRRGRTGRLEDGSVIVLYSKGTRDEIYRWASFHKEKRMLKLIKDMKSQKTAKIENSLLNYTEEKQLYSVVVDYREKNSLIVKYLINQNFKINLAKLEVGDYLLSSRVVLEYKQVPDFVDSIIDGRLLGQLKSLKEHYLRPLIVVEGTEDVYSIRKIDPKAIQGMLATITVSYGIPILYTRNSRETASLIYMITKREQDEGYKEFTMHSAKPLTLKEQQEYLISSLPGIGPKLAKPLLEKFGSPEKVFSASIKELQQIDLIGKKKAENIQTILKEDYEN
ncbi:MAG: DEAD/DEAH box helicase [Nanoarchaeota archaeon]